MGRWGGGFLLLAMLCPCARTQTVLATAKTVPPAAGGTAAAGTASPGSKTFHDQLYKVSFDYPDDWVFAIKDREISAFRLDARYAPRTTVMRAVASIPENPFPESTFSGAYFYLSVTPHSTDAGCAEQAAPLMVSPLTPTAKSKAPVRQMGAMSYAHGHDEQRNICITERDEIYTVFHRGACYRFDLAINNFCGGEVSGVKDITEQELENVRRRMESILGTVRFDTK